MCLLSEIMCFSSLTLMPSITGCASTAIARGLTANEKRSGDREQPWRVPRDKGKGDEMSAFVRIIADEMR